VVESSVKSRLLVAPDTYIGSLENFLLHFDMRSHLGEIRAPTLIIAGEQDAMLKNTNSQDLHQGIAGSKLVVIPKQNHGIFHEVPSLLATEVKNFVLKDS
jgi:pimeloyl-ACP methyl ester carboxylesterase